MNPVAAHSRPREGLAAACALAFQAYRAGDEAAMGDLVDLLTPLLWRSAREQTRTAEHAEEAVSAAWLALVEHADSIREPQAVLGWLLTTLRRHCWATRPRRAIPASLDAVGEIPDAQAGPAEQIVLKDRDRRLWQLVERLTPRCRHLLRVIAYAETPDYAAIAEALGMPIGSIGPTRGRCLARLRSMLAAEAEEPA